MITSSLERNDIDVTKLFSWSNKFTVQDIWGKDKLDIYIRLIGDAELNRSRVYGLRKSAEFRKKLKTLDSDERTAYIPDIIVIDKEQLVEAMVLFFTKEKALDAIRELDIPRPKEPKSDAPLEELEAYQKEIDDYPNKREKLIREYLESRSTKERERLNSLSKEDLYKEYEREIINQLCESEMVGRFREMCVYFGCFLDEDLKERMFKDFEEFENMPPAIKEQLMENYLSLEIGGEDLKNLPDQTQ